MWLPAGRRVLLRTSLTRIRHDSSEPGPPHRVGHPLEVVNMHLATFYTTLRAILHDLCLGVWAVRSPVGRFLLPKSRILSPEDRYE